MPRPKKIKQPDPDVEEFLLYNGEVQLKFKESSHRTAVIDGGQTVKPGSVTTILGVLNKPGLVPWACNAVADFCRDQLTELFSKASFSPADVFRIVESARLASERLKQEAADIGTGAHEYLHQYWHARVQKLDIPPVPQDSPEIKNCVGAALDWFSNHKVEPILIERPLYSRKYKFTGRPDLIARIDGEPATLDYKSTKAIWPEIWLQLAPYAFMYNEEFGLPVETRWALRLDKYTGEFEDKKHLPDTMSADMDSFLCCLTIYERMKHLRRKEKPDTPADWLTEL